MLNKFLVNDLDDRNISQTYWGKGTFVSFPLIQGFSGLALLTY